MSATNLPNLPSEIGRSAVTIRIVSVTEGDDESRSEAPPGTMGAERDGPPNVADVEIRLRCVPIIPSCSLTNICASNSN